MKILLTLLLLIFSTPTLTQNYITYVTNPHFSILEQIITDHYKKQKKTVGMRQVSPPITPEIWYFLSDSQPEFLKYKVSSNNGSLSITKDILSDTERYYSNEAQKIRTETKAAWLAFELEASHPPPQNKPQSENCGANGALESEDSGLDYFSNYVFRNKLKDQIMAQHFMAETRITSIQSGIGAISLGGSWRSAGTTGTVTMPDTSTLVFTLDTTSGVNTPILLLQHSRAANGYRLVDYFRTIGKATDDHFALKAGTYEPADACAAQELEVAMKAVAPDVFQGEYAGGASEGHEGFGSCRAADGRKNLWIVTLPIYSVLSTGHAEFHYNEQSIIELEDGGKTCQIFL